MHPGQGPGLSLHDLGETGGSRRPSRCWRPRSPPTPTPCNVQQRSGQPRSRRRRRRGSLGRRATSTRRTGQPANLAHAGAERAGARRRRPAAQQHAALPDPQLQHRPAGRLPAARREPYADTWPAGRPARRRPTPTASSCSRVYGVDARRGAGPGRLGARAARGVRASMQFEAQDARLPPRATRTARFDVIEVDGAPAGRLYVDRRPGDLRIVDIALLPEFRGRGVGRRLLTDLQAQAAAEGRDREHPRRGPTTGPPRSTSGSASWSPRTSASTGGWSGPT